MCGRFDNLIARDAYRGLFKAHRLARSNFPLRNDVARANQIPIVRIDPRHGVREVAVHALAEGRRQRVIDAAHLDGVAGAGVTRARVELPGDPQSPALLRPLAEYEALVGGGF